MEKETKDLSDELTSEIKTLTEKYNVRCFSFSCLNKDDQIIGNSCINPSGKGEVLEAVLLTARLYQAGRELVAGMLEEQKK